MVGRSVRALGSLAVTLAICCGTVLPAPAVAQETTLPMGDYGQDDYSLVSGPTGTGETKLYLRHDQYVNVTNEDALQASRLAVTIPVGIHFVLDHSCDIHGPADHTVMFVNKMQTSSVHVSGIAVLDTSDADIVTRSAFEAGSSSMGMTGSSKMWLRMCPDVGTIDTGSFELKHAGGTDEFGAYVGDEAKNPTNKHDWDMAPGDVIALDSLGGRTSTDGVYSKISAAEDVQIGSVRWTVRVGTRSEADMRDASVVLRFNANGGTYLTNATLQDESIQVLDTEALPERVVAETIEEPVLPSGEGVLELRTFNRQTSSVQTKQFEGWYIDSQCLEPYEGLESLGDMDEIAGKTFTLYANYE